MSPMGAATDAETLTGAVGEVLGAARSAAAGRESRARRGSARQTCLEVVNSALTEERVEEFVNGLLGMTTQQWAHCPDCRKKVQVEVPDFKRQLDGLVVLLEQAEGKPEQVEVGVTFVVERPAV